MSMKRTMKRTGPAFTLIEVLFVVGIIAILLGLLLPSLASVRASGRATKSMSNLRQWGVATMMYANLFQETVPWEGTKEANLMSFCFYRNGNPSNGIERGWWANALPPFVGAQPYAELSERLQGAGAQVPLPPEDDIFLDPSAVAPLDAPYLGQGLQFFFCYVPNAQLNNTLQQRAIASGVPPLEASFRNRIRLSHIRDSETTILMVEMRTVAEELKRQDPHFGRSLNRHRADWKRFAARHFDGGHMLFADGSARHVTNESATTNRQGSRDPDTPGGDWNTARLTWDPLGPAID